MLPTYDPLLFSFSYPTLSNTFLFFPISCHLSCQCPSAQVYIILHSCSMYGHEDIPVGQKGPQRLRWEVTVCDNHWEQKGVWNLINHRRKTLTTLSTHRKTRTKEINKLYHKLKDLFILTFLFFWTRASLYSSDWPWTDYVVQGVLKLKTTPLPLPSKSWDCRSMLLCTVILIFLILLKSNNTI